MSSNELIEIGRSEVEQWWECIKDLLCFTVRAPSASKIVPDDFVNPDELEF